MARSIAGFDVACNSGCESLESWADRNAQNAAARIVDHNQRGRRDKALLRVGLRKLPPVFLENDAILLRKLPVPIVIHLFDHALRQAPPTPGAVALLEIPDLGARRSADRGAVVLDLLILLVFLLHFFQLFLELALAIGLLLLLGLLLLA